IRASTHTYIPGGSGLGKTSAMLLLISHDIARGAGVGVTDPHGDLYTDCLKVAYSVLAKSGSGTPDYSRCVAINPMHPDYAAGINPLEVPDGEDPYPYVLELMAVLAKNWPDAFAVGARMEDILRNTLLVLMEHNLTLLEIPWFLTDEDFRAYLLSTTRNEMVREFWERRFDILPKREKATWIESSANKISKFISDPLIYAVVGQTHSTIDFRDCMDNQKTVPINLAKGRLKENSNLLGSFLISKIQEAALSRIDIPQEQRVPFFLYVDEFQNYGASQESFDTVLSEARKYRLHMGGLAHQTLSQLDPALRDSILTNCDIQLYFRINRYDAELLARHAFQATGRNVKHQRYRDTGMVGPVEPVGNPIFQPLVEEWEDYINRLTSLPFRQACLVIRGRSQAQFLHTVDTPRHQVSPAELAEFEARVIENYARPREAVRREIAERRERLEREVEAFVEVTDFRQWPAKIANSSRILSGFRLKSGLPLCFRSAIWRF
ncbi:MAG: type IV secretory system conjugative DNA transfer family protein, partial [Candidatus Zixiibacteriota bacterium]